MNIDPSAQPETPAPESPAPESPAPESNPNIDANPPWFDAARQVHGFGGGVFEIGTGVLLGEDGEPASGAVRALRAAAAAKPVDLTPPRRARDTRQIVEAAALAGNQE